jgi:dihydrofolate reductase
MFTLYNVISLDGYMADNNGSEDFIPNEMWVGFINLCKKYGSFITGRKTYEAIQKYDDELLRTLEELSIKKIVVSNDKEFKPRKGYIVAHSLQEAFSLAPNGLVSSGPTLNNSILKAGLADKIILRKLPVRVGRGIPAFDKDLVRQVPIEEIS